MLILSTDGWTAKISNNNGETLVVGLCGNGFKVWMEEAIGVDLVARNAVIVWNGTWASAFSEREVDDDRVSEDTDDVETRSGDEAPDAD